MACPTKDSGVEAEVKAGLLLLVGLSTTDLARPVANVRQLHIYFDLEKFKNLFWGGTPKTSELRS